MDSIEIEVPEDWESEEDPESVKRAIQMLLDQYDLDPDDVLSAIRREGKIRESNESQENAGRPKKVEPYSEELVDVLIHYDADDETVLYEFFKRMQEMVDEVSKPVELKLRRRLEKKLGYIFKKPLYRIEDKEELEELLEKRRSIRYQKGIEDYDMGELRA